MKQEVKCNKDETGKTIGEVVISSQATENNLYKIVYYRQEDLPKLILLIFIIGIIFGGLGLGLGWWLL